jgi:WXG100 family type VII secretion target
MYLQGCPLTWRARQESGVTPVPQGVSLESPVLKRTANRSVEIAADIQSVRNTANSQLVPCLNQWKGSAAVAAASAWQQLDAHLSRLHQALANIGDALGVVQTTYVNTDLDQGQNISKVGQQASSITVALGPQ